MLLVYLLEAAAQAAELEVGGGVDAIAGVVHPPAGAWSTTAGLRQLEGDLRLEQGPVTLEVALDAAATVAVPLPVVFGLVPEQATVTADTGPVWIAGGIAPAPWRLEHVDGWDNALVTWSAEDRGFLPGSLLGLSVGSGTPARGLSVAAGLDLGRGLDLLGDMGAAVTAAPLLVGIRGATTEKQVSVAGGLFALPDSPAVAAQIGADLDLDPVQLGLQAVGGWNVPFGGHIQVGLFPKEVVSPALRAEYFAGQAGATLGLAVRPRPWFVTKAELGWVAGVPQAWVEVAVFRPWPPGEKSRGKGSKKTSGRSRRG